jgi:hypothetical protein
MKLPDKKRDRWMLLAFVVTTVVALAYLGWSVFWVRLQKERDRNTSKQDELAGKIVKAERELKQAPGYARKYAAAQDELNAMVSNRLLRPILGSYQLSLQARLNPVIRGSGFQLATVTSISNQPFPARDSTGTFACLLAEITGTGSFDVICRMIEAVLAVSPCIQVSEITIQGQGKEKPETHRASIRIEWPILAQEKE